MYPQGIKNKSLKLLQEGQKVSVISEATGVSKTTLYRWGKELTLSGITKKFQSTQTIVSVKNIENKTFIPANNFKQGEKANNDSRKYLIISKNKLIGTLIERFMAERKTDQDKSKQTLKEVNRLIAEVLEEDSKNMYTLSYAIKVAKLQGKVLEAIRLLERQLEITPNNNIILKELAELKEIQNEAKPNESVQTERTIFVEKYKRLRASKNIKELESLLRNRLSNYPDDMLLRNQLAGVLLDKIELNPNEIETLLPEVRRILFELSTLFPNNLTVKSNLIRLAKISNNEQDMEKNSRDLVEQNPRNYVAKTQLAQILINRYKKEGIMAHLEEATTLAKQVLQEHSNNKYARGQLIEIAKLKKDIAEEEKLLRQAIESNPNDIRLKSGLAGCLIANCIEQVKNTGNIDVNDKRIIEAKEILLSIFKEEPRNLYIITHFINIAKLQSDIWEIRRLLMLKLEIDPNDTRAQEDLEKVNDKIQGSNREYGDDKDVNPKKELSLIQYKDNLLNAIKLGDKDLILDILNEMDQDPSISEDSKGKVHTMIDLAKSSKIKSQIALRGKVQELEID